MKKIKYLSIIFVGLFLTGCADIFHIHTYQGEYQVDENYHYRVCECGYEDKQSHLGGVATCQELAECEVCNTRYGELIECNYLYQFDDDLHWLECKMCNKVKDETSHEYTFEFDDDYHFKNCVCGNIIEQEEHKYDLGVITLDQTNISSGIKKYCCTGCNHTYEKILPLIDGYEVDYYPHLSNADVVYYDGNIYTYGGNAYGRTNSIYCYSINTDKLYKLNVKLKQESTSHRVLLVGSKVYIFGGLANSGRPKTILVHDLESQTLEELEVSLPFGLNCFQVGYYKNNIYFIGGTGELGNFNKIYSFSLETFEFNELTVSLPSVVFKGAWCTVGKYAYVIGGTSGKRLTSIYRFDMENHIIDTMNATLPEAISQSRAAYDGNGKIYIYGGTNESNELVDYIVEYNIESDTAEFTSYKLPQKLANICTAKTEQGIYILGGNNDYIDIIIKHSGDEILPVRTSISIK